MREQKASSSEWLRKPLFLLGLLILVVVAVIVLQENFTVNQQLAGRALAPSTSFAHQYECNLQCMCKTDKNLYIHPNAELAFCYPPGFNLSDFNESCDSLVGTDDKYYGKILSCTAQFISTCSATGTCDSPTSTPASLGVTPRPGGTIFECKLECGCDAASPTASPTVETTNVSYCSAYPSGLIIHAETLCDISCGAELGIDGYVKRITNCAEPVNGGNCDAADWADLVIP